MQKKNDPLINTLTSKLIFIGGVTRSGKSFLCPIVSTFKKTEMFIYNSVAENIYYLNFLKMISNKTFIIYLSISIMRKFIILILEEI